MVITGVQAGSQYRTDPDSRVKPNSSVQLKALTCTASAVKEQRVWRRRLQEVRPVVLDLGRSEDCFSAHKAFAY